MGVKNEIGKTYGKLKVVSQSERKSKYGVYWNCMCACGNKATRLGVYLRRILKDFIPSCGCAKRNGPQRTIQNKMLRQHYSSYKSSNTAKLKGFKLSLEDLNLICRQQCYYCGGNPPKRRVKYRSEQNGPLYAEDFLNGIDRIDNSLGYLKDNCVPCCPTCNHMKHTLTKTEFIKHINKITNFQNNKNLTTDTNK